MLEELQERASAIIARATGAEAGMVTGGAAAGLLLATAFIAGEDPAKIRFAPRHHRYEGQGRSCTAPTATATTTASQQAGRGLVDVGSREEHRMAELDAAIADQTALVVYLMSPGPGWARSRSPRPAPSPTPRASRSWWTPPPSSHPPST
ncbi:MAG: hypothetical protein U0232_32185 [Thermomicrobiales bacterium]